MKRLLALSAAVFAFSGCNCISASDVTGFRCGDGGVCEEGFTCCADSFCRADCTGGVGGGNASTGGGTGGSGGSSGGSGGSGGEQGGGAGGGMACLGGELCSGNPNACKTGRTSCNGSASSCIDGENVLDGIGCGNGNICSQGSCVTCTPGIACGTNPDPCVEGTLTCNGGAVCTDTANKKATGASCGIDKVCSASGACVACAQNAACTGNMSACKNGRTECSTGAPQCVDGTDKAAGTSCGMNLVCNATGACVTCVVGAACATNPDPCRDGTQTCTGGAACVDGTPKSVGASCGTGRVCSATGACVACVANQMCSTNPTPCKQGVTSCATGASTCIDTAANRTPGTGCGANQVCSPVGTCTACTQGAACTGNPTFCKQGTTDCGSGAPVCVDSAANQMNGTMCGAGLTCNGGICGMCTPGAACTGNPTPCRVGVQSCTGAAPACLDGVGNRPPGASCGTNQVCNSAGSCVACTAGVACGTNPGAPCKQGVTSCSTGAQVCVDGANAMDGLGCGTTQFGAYSACSYAAACSNGGSRSRGRTDFTCRMGACDTTTTTETDTAGCARNQDGTTCNTQTCGNFGACSYAGECSNGGSRTRTCTAFTCGGGSCNGSNFTDTDTAGCARTQDGRICGAGTSCGAFTTCSYPSACSNSGSRTQQCQDFTCGGNACNAGAAYTRTDTAGCARNTAGDSCGTPICGTCFCNTDCLRVQNCNSPTCTANQTCLNMQVEQRCAGSCFGCIPR